MLTCEKYPLGVKVSFRAYSSDEVSLIKKGKVARNLVPHNDSARAFHDLQTLENELNPNNTAPKRLFPGIIVDENDDKDDLETRGINADTIELINSIGYEPVKVEVNEFEGQGNCFVLKSIPSGSTIYPQPFVEGFRADLEKINNTVKSKLSQFGDTVREWDTFMREEAPQTDDAEQFHKESKPLYIPFREELFGMGAVTEAFS